MAPSHRARSSPDIALLREAADALPALISYIGADERYRFVNRAYSEWFGHAPEAIVGRTMAEVLGPEAYAAMQPHLAAALRGETVRFETHAKYRDGGARDIDAAYVPRRAPNGPVEGFYVLVQDVSRRKAAEAAREASEARLSAVLESVTDGFLALDTHWRLTLFNRGRRRASASIERTCSGAVSGTLRPR